MDGNVLYEVPVQPVMPMDSILSRVKVLERYLGLNVKPFTRNMDGDGVANDVAGAHRIS